MEGRYNTRSPAVKRLMKEAQELSEPTEQYYAHPLEDNLFEWHFTVRGPQDTDFQNGIYHGRIILPVDYPMKPPSIIWLTPNGRFEINKKICLSISGHHPESWQPSWSIRTALLAIIGFMPTHSGGAIGALDYKPDERKLLAKKSRDWKCPTCGDIKDVLLEPSALSSTDSQEARELATQINFQGEKPKCKESECPIEKAVVTGASSVTTSVAESTLTVDAKITGATESKALDSAPLSSGVKGLITTSTQNTLVSSQSPQPWGYPATVFPPNSNVSPSSYPGHPWSVPFNPAKPNDPLHMMPRFPFPPSFYPSGYMPQFYPAPFTYPGAAFSVPSSQPQRIPVDLSLDRTLSPATGPVETHTPSNNTSVEMSNAVPSSSLNQTHAQLTTATTLTSSGSPARSSSGYTRGPMTVPILSHTFGSDSRRNDPPAAVECDVHPSAAKGKVMKELLTKVKRVGSEANTEEKLEGGEMEAGPSGLSSGTEMVDSTQQVDDAVGDSSLVENVTDRYPNSAQGWTDSEVSVSLHRKDSCSDKTETLQAELAADGDNSEEGVLPIDIADTEQKSNFANSSSMSDLEKRKQRQQVLKGLRQRQSASARVPTDINEDATTPDQSTQNGQRIEAASGDTSTRLTGRNMRPVNRPHAAARPNYRDMLVGARNRNSPVDLTLLIMIILSIATFLILMNRIFQMMDWSYYYAEEENLN